MKCLAIHGTDMTIGEGIEGFIEDRGVKIVQGGFRPKWGAEETRKNIFKVSFVYEVGREADWVSWEVDTVSRKVKPLDLLARELIYGKI
ncbi:MAG: hypothetical protein PHP64_01690 [Actinomycetota bacterium]|nr:hypothetical protein [Actinomycetota bacterium]